MTATPAGSDLAWARSPVMRIWRLVVLSGFAFLALHLAAGLGGRSLDHLADRWVYDALEVLAALGCLLRAASNRRERGAWAVLGAGMLSFALGDVCFDFVYNGSPPGVSICDAFYLAFYPACYAALALLVRSRVSSFNRGVWLDGAIAALAASSVSASIVLEGVIKHTHGRRTVMAVDLAYPVADLVLLAVVIMGLVLTGRRSGRAWIAAAFAFGVITAADSIFLYLNSTGGYAEGTLLDALWPGAMLLLAVAAWQPQDLHEKSAKLEGRFLAVTPLVCGGIALIVLVADRFDRHTLVADLLAAGAILMVFIRTGVSFADNAGLLDRVRTQSLTDYLTGLGNRRSLMLAIERELRRTQPEPMALALFDLNGFKRYNDTFGHPSGDVLLARLGANLTAAVAGRGGAYRLGGDEFCVLVPAGPSGVEEAIELGVTALTESGEGFEIGTGFGAVLLPEEAADSTNALRLADERLYEQKYSQPQGEEPVHAALLDALSDRDPELGEHVRTVASLALLVGERLGMTGPMLEQLGLAAELHDLGKLAIPDSILLKPGALTEEDWSIMRRHTVIGQRILASSPAMREVGRIVRATHERWDGSGYVDRLAGPAIPLAARIIAVCDAFTAMTSDRPYRLSLTESDALHELRRCAGSQFDPAVVDAFCALEREGLLRVDEPVASYV